MRGGLLCIPLHVSVSLQTMLEPVDSYTPSEFRYSIKFLLHSATAGRCPPLVSLSRCPGLHFRLAHQTLQGYIP